MEPAVECISLLLRVIREREKVIEEMTRSAEEAETIIRENLVPWQGWGAKVLIKLRQGRERAVRLEGKNQL